jgi:hypothetical protein
LTERLLFQIDWSAFQQRFQQTHDVAVQLTESRVEICLGEQGRKSVIAWLDEQCPTAAIKSLVDSESKSLHLRVFDGSTWELNVPSPSVSSKPMLLQLPTSFLPDWEVWGQYKYFSRSLRCSHLSVVLSLPASSKWEICRAQGDLLVDLFCPLTICIVFFFEMLCIFSVVCSVCLEALFLLCRLPTTTTTKRRVWIPDAVVDREHASYFFVF